MISITNKQMMIVHALACEIHMAESKQRLMEIVISDLPRLLGVGYTVWHDRIKNEGLDPNSIYALDDHVKAIQNYLPMINSLLHTHPIVVGLDMQDGLEIPDEVVTTMDFASGREIKDTAIYCDAYRHLEIENHAVLEFFSDDNDGAMICINTDKALSTEQISMIQLVRDHLAIAYCKLDTDARAESFAMRYINAQLYETLSKREKETLPFVVRGKTNVEIAVILGISRRTVEKHVASILNKLGLENRKMLIAEAQGGYRI